MSKRRVRIVARLLGATFSLSGQRANIRYKSVYRQKNKFFSRSAAAVAPTFETRFVSKMKKWGKSLADIVFMV